MMGINTYGNREVAKVRDNRVKLSYTFKEIVCIQRIDMFIACLLYILIALIFVKNNVAIYLIVLMHLLSSMFDITWFFYGLEEFKKTCTRSIFVRLATVFFIFCFCHTEQDLYIYAFINVGFEFLGQLLLYYKIDNYIDNININFIDAYKKHIKPTIQLFVPTIAISVYTMLDQTMLGYMYSKEHLEYYKTSLSFVKMFLYFITAIGTVMLPRITNMFYKTHKDMKKIEGIINSTLEVVLLLAIPMVVGMYIVSPVFISWYLPTASEVGILIQISSIIVIFMSVSNVLGIQFLIPVGMYNEYTKSVCVGAIINFMFNLIMIPRYGAYGAIIGSVLAEFLVAVVEFYFVRKCIKIKLINIRTIIYLVASLIMGITIRFFIQMIDNAIFSSIISILIGVLIYFVILYVLKDIYLMKIIDKIKNRY